MEVKLRDRTQYLQYLDFSFDLLFSDRFQNLQHYGLLCRCVYSLEHFAVFSPAELLCDGIVFVVISYRFEVFVVEEFYRFVAEGVGVYSGYGLD